MANEFNLWGWTFPKPEDRPLLPPDITDVSSSDLGQLHTELTAWADYAEAQQTQAQLAERQALREKEMLEQRLLHQRMGAQVRGERVTAIKAEVAQNQDIIDLDFEYEKAYAYRKMVEVITTNLARDIALVSREITRRGNERFRKDFS